MNLFRQILEDVLKMAPKHRKPSELNRLIPFVKGLPFFKDRGLKDTAITETLSLMTFKQMRADEVVIDYGSFGDEFYVILEGEVEGMVPDKRVEEVKQMCFEANVWNDKLQEKIRDIESFECYLDELKQFNDNSDEEEDDQDGGAFKVHKQT